MNPDNIVEKKMKKFVDYYKDPEYRMKYLERQRERIECECGSLQQRSGISTHRKTPSHRRKRELKQKEASDMQAKLEAKLEEKLEEKLGKKLDSKLIKKLDLIIQMLDNS